MAHSFMASRVREFGTSIFSEISALARRHHAVNLGQGFPDFDGPEAVKQAAQQAIAEGRNQYALSHGEHLLREAIAAHSLRFYNQEIDPTSEVTVTSGATEALFCSALAFLEPGDEAIVFEPCYDSYVPAIQMAGATVIPVTLHAPDFRFDPDELRAAFSVLTKVIYINTPHNPSGTVFSSEELSLIVELCCEYDVLAITDEVYEHLTYGVPHLRLALFPGMKDRTLTISSAGKSFSCTGWKIGWAIGADELQTALRRVHQFSVFASSTPLQYAVAHALHLPDEYYQKLITDYLARRNFLFHVLAESGLQPKQPQGSYFILANISNFPYENGLLFARALIQEIGVAAIPLDTLYLRPEFGKQYVRFTFCKQWQTLEAAAKCLVKLQEYRGSM